MALLVGLVLTVLSFGQTATASIDEAADALRRGSVYVEPGAEDVVGDDDLDRVRQRIADEGLPLKVAILTQETIEAAGGSLAAITAVADATGVTSSYALVGPSTFRAGPGRAAQLSTEAFNAARQGGPDAVLVEFVDRFAAASTGGSPAGDGTSNGGDGGGSLLPLLLVGAVGGGAFLFIQARKNNRRVAEERQALQGAQQDLLAELSVLADDVLRLEPEVQLHPEAQPDYEAAVSRYKWLEAAIPQIDSADDPPRIQRAMTEARYAMARAQAIVRGQAPPPPPADLTHPGRYGEPAIEVDDEDEYRRPRYAGYGGGWYGGGFFAGNDLFTGLLLGSMLSGGFGGFGWGGGWGGDGGGDQGDGGDAGDWGGDFGGGDFGGGDFGGGDFGGGDW